MTSVAIEINDVGLTAAGERGPIGSPSPGYALLDRRELVTGEPARAAARLEPRFVSHQHWDTLDLHPVGRPFPRGLTRADLVHAHLSSYWSEIEASLQATLPSLSVLLAVPASYSIDQLSLLLGIARSCDIAVTGLVDSAIVGLDDRPQAGRGLHLDLQLHRAVWTLVEADERLTRRASASVEDAGLVDFQGAWTRYIAERFVTETRFDPLHCGPTEQALYDLLPSWVDQTAESDGAVLAMEGGGRQRTVEVSSAQLVGAAEDRFAALIDAAHRLLAGEPADWLALSRRAARIPGLHIRVADLGAGEPRQLEPAAAATGALRHRDRIAGQGLRERGSGLPLVHELPVLEHHG